MSRGWRLRFLEWKFRKFHKHAFHESAVGLQMGSTVWVRFDCAHCEAHTWDLIEEKGSE